MFAEIYRQKQLPEGACQKDVLWISQKFTGK